MNIANLHNHIIFRNSEDAADLSKFLSESKKLGITLVGITLNTRIPEIQREIIEFKKDKKMDPYFKSNIYMMEALQSGNFKIKIFPFLYLPPEVNLAKKSMKLYEEKYGNKEFGYKIHSQGIREEIKNINGINSVRPVIIHSSVDYSTPKDILECFSEYKGNVLLAHFAKFDTDVLKEISSRNNFFIDSCISTWMFNALASKSSRVYNSQGFEDLKSPEELYIKASNICGEDKLLFATDYPLSDYKKERDILLNIPRENINKIAYENALRFIEPKKK